MPDLQQAKVPKLTWKGTDYGSNMFQKGLQLGPNHEHRKQLCTWSKI